MMDAEVNSDIFHLEDNISRRTGKTATLVALGLLLFFLFFYELFVLFLSYRPLLICKSSCEQKVDKLLPASAEHQTYAVFNLWYLPKSKL